MQSSIIHKLFFRAITALCIFSSAPFTAEAQKEKSGILFKAMEDELRRNIDSLFIPGWEKPFFIRYAIQEGTLFQVQAMLGALTGVNEIPLNNMCVQVLTGDYRLANINHVNTDYCAGSLKDLAPLDKNYREIRRRLWLLTDDAYKKAIEEYSNKMNSIRQLNLSQEMIDLPDFIKLPAVDYINAAGKMSYDKARWEKTARDCSAVLKKYPEIYGSNVGIEVYSGNTYSINSEGTKLLHPSRLIVVAVNAYTKTEDGEEISDRLTYYGLSEEDIPVENLVKDVEAMADNLMALALAPKIEESYTGPVLLEGSVAASRLASELLATQTGLVAFRLPLKSGSVQKLMEDRLNRKILPADITVKSTPYVKKYNGKTLIGSYEMDTEGVAPAEELLLVENGMLRMLMCDRVPTLKIGKPTGNRVYTYQPQNITTRVSPGVLHISSSGNLSPDSLRSKLLSAAKEEGLDEAYILRNLPNGRYASLYKVRVSDGSEQLVRSGTVSGINLARFKRALSSSPETTVLNLIAGGVPVSIICPYAMLLEEVEIEKTNLQNTTKLPVVDNPLGN
jgi:hypothetical protein